MTLYYFLEEATIFCWLWVPFGHFEDYSSFFLSIHTFSCSFKHTSSSLPPAHLPAHSSLSLRWTTYPIASYSATLTALKAVDGVSPQLLPLAHLVAYLQARLHTSSCSPFSAVHPLTLSLICFHNSSMTHNWNSKKDLERTTIHRLNTSFPILSSPLTLECKVEKLETVSLLVAFLRLRLWSTWEQL